MGEEEFKAHKLRQEETERFYLDKFLEVVRLKPESIERGADPPDFLVAIDEGHVAIEETDFHSDKKGVDGSSRRGIEEEWLRLQRVFVQERELYPDLDRICGFLFFRALEVPPRRKHGLFASELLGFARKELERITEKGVDFASLDPAFPLLGKYLTRLRLWDARCYVTWEWSHNADFVGLTQEELRRIIVVSGRQLSQSMGLVEAAKLNRYQEINRALELGPYDKVYIFQHMETKILLWQPSSSWNEVNLPQSQRSGVRSSRENGD